MLPSTMDEALSGGAGSSGISLCSPLAFRTDSLAAISPVSAGDDDDAESFSTTVVTPRLSVHHEDVDIIVDVEGDYDDDDDSNSSKATKTVSAPTPSTGRRVYTTQFKLHVLDTYRNDEKCRGNQRATARKFGIHRRQIQKWLQGEQNLRASLNNNEPELPAEMDEALNLCMKPEEQYKQYKGQLLLQEMKQQQDRWSPSGSVSPPAAPPSGGKRRSFTLQFKLDVLDAFYNNESCISNQRATARHFKINRRQVQKWLSQEQQLRREAALASPDRDSPARRQRLGRNVWPVPQPQLPAPFPPPQENPLCLVVRPRPQSTASRPHAATPLAPHPYASARWPPPGLLEETRETAKRQSYPLGFKLKVLDAYHHSREYNGNQRAVARNSGINRRQVQKWLQQEETLRERARMSDRPTMRPLLCDVGSAHTLSSPFMLPNPPFGSPPSMSPSPPTPEIPQCVFSHFAAVTSSGPNFW
ncbi:Hypothetical predicted protein [Cloeon dipterum]|uniref:Brinker DNA-binding domain-containing protein n=1 Tax=Cloeon dipterum TaxID=197152 RepID=A0A8S1CMI4_9INSE|nr:Hypothetical predicted protein [Cloeon dipterum]